MAKMFDVMKQVRQVKKMQKELAGKTVECSSPDGKVTVVARADMSVKSVRIDPEGMDSANAERLQKVLASTVNAALDSAKKVAAEDMSRLTGGLGGLSGLLDG